jgi:hypothetical protein
MTTTTNSPGRAAIIDVKGTSKSFGQTKALAAGAGRGGAAQQRAQAKPEPGSSVTSFRRVVSLHDRPDAADVTRTRLVELPKDAS